MQSFKTSPLWELTIITRDLPIVLFILCIMLCCTARTLSIMLTIYTLYLVMVFVNDWSINYRSLLVKMERLTYSNRTVNNIMFYLSYWLLHFFLWFTYIYSWAESSKTFDNLWIQLHKILKFGPFVILLDPLKIFQNLFIWMLHTTFTTNQKFPMGKP